MPENITTRASNPTKPLYKYEKDIIYHKHLLRL